MISRQRWKPQRNTREVKVISYPIAFDAKKSELFYKYCNKSGYKKEKYYKLVGYPAHFKFNGNKQRKAPYGSQRAHVALAEEGSSEGVGENNFSTVLRSQGFTKEQCEQLINMFQSVQVGAPSASSSDVVASANFAGNQTNVHVYIGSFSSHSFTPRIIDSGATQHITFDKSLLHNIKDFSVPRLVNLPNSYKVKVIYAGSIFFTPDFVLHNILFIPTFHHNLLLEHQLCYHDNCILIFCKFSYFFQALQ